MFMAVATRPHQIVKDVLVQVEVSPPRTEANNIDDCLNSMGKVSA